VQARKGLCGEGQHEEGTAKVISSRESCGIPAGFPLLPTIHHSESRKAKVTSAPAQASTLASAFRAAMHGR
jgi:hypothetical protein